MTLCCLKTGRISTDSQNTGSSYRCCAFSNNLNLVIICMLKFFYIWHSYLHLCIGPGEEDEDWTAKFCKVISERLGMATGEYVNIFRSAYFFCFLD